MSTENIIYKANNFPVLQNQMFDDKVSARTCKRGNILLVQNHETGLIYNTMFDSKLTEYSLDYHNEQAHSSSFKKHLDNVSGIIQKYFYNNEIIEIGSGKGYFLEYLQKLGFKISGFDPAYEGNNPSISKKYFGFEDNFQADGIILRHVLEHIKDPINFLKQIQKINLGSGKIYIEVPCFSWIIEHKAWFDIFYEHVNYFRLDDFYQMFDVIYESGYLFEKQYIYIVADLSSIKTPVVSNFKPLFLPEDFLISVNKFAEFIKRSNQKSAIWGGSSKGVIFNLFMEKLNASLEVIIDINPSKQGKYIAATGTRVYSPDEAMKILDPGALIFVMNSNYMQEIVECTQNNFKYIGVDHE